MTTPKYRMLRKGETIREGDEVKSNIGTWVFSYAIGHRVKMEDFTTCVYRRRIRKGEK